jgi:hypothetical protein
MMMSTKAAIVLRNNKRRNTIQDPDKDKVKTGREEEEKKRRILIGEKGAKIKRSLLVKDDF